MTRRPPPPFLTADVGAREWITPRLVRIGLRGPDLGRLEVTQPASSVRVLLPDGGRLEMPEWDGNRFVLPGGGRPPLRTLTPLHHDRGAGAMDLYVVVHGDGAASRWAASAEAGAPAAVSGPARGYDVDAAATGLVLGGDETAYPAICSIVEAATIAVSVYLEVEGDFRPPLPAQPLCRVEWLRPVASGPGRAVAEALGALDLPAGDRVWAAGEAAAMQQLRQTLFQTRGLPRAQAVIRGYWKYGRASEDIPGAG